VFDVVVAADLDWGIGKASGLPWPKLKGDLAHFKRVTTTAPEGQRNAIIMGRRTWESTEVAGRPLPRRLNIVISRNMLLAPEGVLAARSLDEALNTAAKAPGIAATFVVGGAQIFREALAHAALSSVYLTRVEGRFGCDTMIPNLDAMGFVPTTWDGACSDVDNHVSYEIERLVRG